MDGTDAEVGSGRDGDVADRMLCIGRSPWVPPDGVLLRGEMVPQQEEKTGATAQISLQ
jgi:hypothetical protein